MTGIEPHPSERRWRWRLLQWPLVWLVVLVTLVLGVVGFARLATNPRLSWPDALYGTLQLFVLGASFDAPLNWQLQLARFLAPGVMAYTATQAFLVLFREQLRLLRLRVTRGHVVVCGLGRAGFKVASDFLRRGEVVVVIEEDEENDWIAMIEALGATVLVGDATEALLLGQARLDHARWLVVVCGHDGANVEVAIRAWELKRADSPRSGPVLECQVQIVDPNLRALFREHRVFTDTGDRCRVVLFNIYESSARLLLRRHPLDRERIGPEDPRVAHLVVIGFGEMGESLVLQAARTSHFANGRRLRITVIDQDPRTQQRRFLQRHPRLDTVCDLSFEARDADSADSLADIAMMCVEPGVLATVAICFDNDARGLSLALALLPALKGPRVPILLRMTSDGGLATLLDADLAASRLAGLVRPFPVVGLSTQEEDLFHRELDAGAIVVHEEYRRQRRLARHDPADPSMRDWEELDEDFRDSNRQQADHIEVKLRAVGMAAEAGDGGMPGPVAEFTTEEIEVLSRMEHARWNAERFLSGWAYAPGRKDAAKKTSPHLVDWNSLSEEIREFDREAVRNIPRLIGASGRRLVRLADGPANGVAAEVRRRTQSDPSN